LTREGHQLVILGEKREARMAKLKTLTAYYEEYGLKPPNILYAWTACDEKKKNVAMTFWAHEFDDSAQTVYTQETTVKSPEALDTPRDLNISNLPSANVTVSSRSF
jgi:hypothetical protein